MKKTLLTALLLLPSLGFSAEKHDPAQLKKDIERHRIMATAHEAAAKCLESGAEVQQCHKALQGACKGAAIGKFCGMRHAH